VLFLSKFPCRLISIAQLLEETHFMGQPRGDTSKNMTCRAGAGHDFQAGHIKLVSADAP